MNASRPALNQPTQPATMVGRVTNHEDAMFTHVGRRLGAVAVAALAATLIAALPALAQNDVRIPRREHVLGRQQELARGGCQPALQKDRAPAATRLGEQRRVGHVSRAYLEHVRHARDRIDVTRIEDLRDDRDPDLFLDAPEALQAARACALKGIR